jgi:hypothetical protein
VGLERGPLSLVTTIEELLGRKSSGSGVESREYGRVDPLRWPRGTLHPQKLALTSPTVGGRYVDIVRSRTKATELFIFKRFTKLLGQYWTHWMCFYSHCLQYVEFKSNPSGRFKYEIWKRV